MNLRDKKVIIFDMDGTLIDSVPDIAVAVNRVLETLGYPTYSEATMRNWVGNGATVLVKRALLGNTDETLPLETSLHEEAMQLFFRFYAAQTVEKTRLYPGVTETLHRVYSEGYILALVTNKPYRFVPPLLKGLELDILFSYVLGGDSLAEKKPSPLPLLTVCEHFDIEPKEAVMVGDSHNDILAANAAGME
ncbi:MAG TPA: phosphoglycolate phosphatase, partial [Epsilonproteobacteria bacterium]|nr:phosphoglycolate phosphatase [Campylobacterota bacterium]